MVKDQYHISFVKQSGYIVNDMLFERDEQLAEDIIYQSKCAIELDEAEKL